MRDLLCHHSGLPRHDWIWIPGDLSPKEMLTALRHLEPARDVRTEFQYNNLAYNVAGLVIERVSGLSYEQFIRTRLTDQSADAGRLFGGGIRRGRRCRRSLSGGTRRRAPAQQDSFPSTTTAAGAIITSIAAIANWMKFLLAEGEFAGERLLSPALVREMQAPRVYAGAARIRGVRSLRITGWVSARITYRGERVVGHSGGWLGWQHADAPDARAEDRHRRVHQHRRQSGASILINRIHDHALRQRARAVAGSPARHAPQGARAAEIGRGGEAGGAQLNTRPSHDLADFCGAYEHPAYGRVVITQQWRRPALGLARHQGDAVAPALRFIPAAVCLRRAQSGRSRDLLSRPTATATLRASRRSSSRRSPTSSSPARRAATAWTPRSARPAPATTFAAMHPGRRRRMPRASSR